MVVNKILFGRLGNKQNFIKYFKSLLPLDVTNVIEPFGGSFAVIRCVYKDDKYIKYVNDNDDLLIQIYQNPENYAKLKYDTNEIAKKHVNEKGNVIFKDFIIELDKYIIDNNISADIYNFLKYEIIVRSRMVKIIKSPIDYTENINLMKKINFSYVDWLECVNKHRKNKDSFIFIDPPYLFSDNSNYAAQRRKEGMDCTDIIIHILNMFKDRTTKAKIMLVINDMKIIKMLFAKYIKGEYTQIYGISQRKINHLIICNYDL